jgi:lipid II:glycine glycyltransferase (peptidoglycan interpeptide bridge formation enzyme)
MTTKNILGENKLTNFNLASPHVVQSSKWSEFKNSYGTKSVGVSGIYYTKHKIPFTDHFFGYCPRVNPSSIDFSALKKSAEEQDCININFDVPNVIKGSALEDSSTRIFQEYCRRAPRDQFDKYNFLLDISPDETELLANMHPKTRYNIKYAQKNSVYTKIGSDKKTFDDFFNLLEDTAQRQHYLIHPKKYYELMLSVLGEAGMCKIITAYSGGTALASWMLFIHEDVLYYPFGGSAVANKNLMGSTLLAWDAIKHGKENGCKTFDMWGGCKDLNDKKDPYWGFSNFKAKFGGIPVEYISSYDFVVNPAGYAMFNFANNIRWKVLKFLR